MIRVGIIGCGRVADQHAIEIQWIPGCKIVGVCDEEELMAKQMQERFILKYYFSDVSKLIEITRPDVVHITTPPQSHFNLGKFCLEHGCNVFVEKPFTLNSTEAEELIKLAQEKNLKITVGYNHQFSHAARRMREIINSGYLGGPPVHLESIWCYSFSDPGYAKTILGDRNHWIRSLPGRYLHDILSHPVSRIVEFLKSDSPEVKAHGFVSPYLQARGENDIIDELRVIIDDQGQSTAYLTFSSQITPDIKQFRVYGPKNSLILDHNNQTVIKITKNYTYYLNRFIPPLIYARQYKANSINNIKKFIKSEFHFEAGRRFLIEAFYHSILDNAALPISYHEILLTTRIMDEIFKQIYPNKKY